MPPLIEAEALSRHYELGGQRFDALREVSLTVQAGEFGHPVGFGASFGPALMALSGDRGAKPLFATAKVVEVVVKDGGVLWDVDEPQALVFG